MQLTSRKEQLMELSNVKHYYNRTVFIVLRVLACLVALISVMLETAAVAESWWCYGIIVNSTDVESKDLLDHVKHEHTRASLGLNGVGAWQKVMIVLTVSTIVCGLLAFSLNIRGLYGGTVRLRLYYTHSAGEIYFVAGLCGLTALILYPTIVVQTIGILSELRLGHSYFLNVATTVLLFFCTFCVMLDDLVQMLANPKACLIDCCCACLSDCRKMNSSDSAESSLRASRNDVRKTTTAV